MSKESKKDNILAAVAPLKMGFARLRSTDEEVQEGRKKLTVNPRDPFRSIWRDWATSWMGFDSLWDIQSPVRVGGDENETEILVELPGFSREQIKVEVDEDTLFVDAKNDRKTLSYQSTIYHKVDPDSATVKLENGLLSVKFKKIESAKPKVLEIK